jgi:hypothetical protein
MKKTEPVTLDAPGYDSLASVLKRAFDQASAGKGKERHANALSFDQQPMQTIASQFGVGFLLGQAAKKSQESQALPPGRDVAELLGAINYLAGAVIYLETARKTELEQEFPLGQQYQLGGTLVVNG